MQALPAGAESLCIVEQPFESGAKSALHLNIGLSNGVLLRTTLDSVSGDLADTRTRYATLLLSIVKKFRKNTEPFCKKFGHLWLSHF